MDNLTGGAGNDTFNGANDVTGAITTNTLSGADIINGGAGTDTLNVTLSGTAAAVLGGADVRGVEILNVRNVGTGAAAVDASQVVGLTALNSDRSTGAVTVTNLAAGGTFGVIGNGVVTNGASNFGSVDAATAQTLNITGGTTGNGAITLTGNGVLATTINSSGAANTVGTITAAASSTALTINATSALTTGAVTAANAAAAATVTIAGTANVTTNLSAVQAPTLTISNTTGAIVTGTLHNNTVRVDAAANTGGVTTTLGTSTAMVFTGGSGNDVVTAGAVLAAGAAVNAGAGTDRIVFTDAAHLTAATGAKYVNFEVLQANAAGTYNMNHIAGITALRTVAGTTFENVTAAQAGDVTITAGGADTIIKVTGATTVGQLDTLALKIDDGAAGVGAAGALVVTNLTAAGVETLRLTANDGVTFTTIAGMDALTRLEVTGAGAVIVNAVAATTNVNTIVDASAATGAFTFNAGAANVNGLAITGGSGNDTITGSTKADVIVGGAGNDNITGGEGADRLTGGAGTNTFVFAANASGTPTATNFDVITDWRAGTNNVIDFGGVTLLSGSGGVQAVGQAVIAANGIATFHADDDTVAERITAVQAAIAASGTPVAAVAGEFAIWQQGADAFLFVSDATAGVGAGDVLIQLVGVTVGAGGVTVASGDITAIA